MAYSDRIVFTETQPDLTGKRFGKWTVLSASHKVKKRGIVWTCRCDCGKERGVLSASLIRGLSSSCGCKARGVPKTHGLRRTPEYMIWLNIKQKCRNPASYSYKNYGARGIDICQEWYESFQAFIDSVGRRPSTDLTIGRIDNNKGYEPNNVRWETRLDQVYNRRNTTLITHNGTTKNVLQWSIDLGIPAQRIRQRIADGCKTPLMPVRRVVHTKSTSVSRRSTNVMLECDGTTLCLSEWSKISGINANIIGNRVIRGWSVRDAIFTPVKKQSNNARSH